MQRKSILLGIMIAFVFGLNSESMAAPGQKPVSARPGYGTPNIAFPIAAGSFGPRVGTRRVLVTDRLIWRVR